jgi:hypothetical protein
MKRALIVGAGGFGREVLVWLDDLRRCKGGFEIEGFLDRDPTALGHVDVGLPILGDPAVFELSKDHILVSAIGDPASKLKLADALAHCDVTGHVTLERCVFMGSHAATIPGITVGECAKIGAGSIAVRDVAKGNTVFGVPAKVVFELYR